jgi:radical SAM protein with 4Fe4S-binding SPASM domain
MPDCPVIPEETYGLFSRRVHESVVDERVPIVGSLEPTLRCNLRCVHCYCEGSRDGDELSTAGLKQTIDKIADAGCLWLLITGGEPMLRPDFPEIYLHIKEKGIIPTLFTNGTMVSPEIAELLAEWQPFWVEVSIYGATRETYESVTGVSGSYERCLRGIRLLMEAGVNLKLKTMVLKENLHEIDLMYRYAAGLGLAFRHDALLNPTVGGEMGPAKHRVDPETVIALDRRYNAEIDTWRDFIRQSREIPPAETLISCGSGKYSFHVDPKGMLGLCLLARTETYDLRHGDFEDGWRGVIADIRRRRPPAGHRCSNCNLRHICGCCAAWAGLETGDEEGSFDYLCRIAALRVRAFGGAEARRMGDDMLRLLDAR